MATTKVKAEVLSIGLDDRGASVARLRITNETHEGPVIMATKTTEHDVHINVQDFAKLAAAGLRVYNEFQRNPK